MLNSDIVSVELDKPSLVYRSPAGRVHKSEVVKLEDFDCEKCSMRLEMRGCEQLCHYADSMFGLHNNLDRRGRRKKKLDYKVQFRLVE